MIVIDTSALIAILDQEPERVIFYEVIAKADRRLVSAVAYQEAGHVLIAGRGIDGLYDFDDVLAFRSRDRSARPAARRPRARSVPTIR